ncbi:NIGHT LIGHT-INDUCIBLE AND CLOCK-REGULATED GENE 3 [Hibiscus trionum]|uniref:NIGHT LIGHT-INDUCIBLE AND CLOCK-REGULATED GENE 3 n=1 Tax=Hibiscus trionum TaxID=183268 RepID=A0A9W7I761_HIBTR|nr:NIGHT LIGHT-INDUCIBLE AND CLOCK-REGULATED GENE 3 [Hibiscus trionum]
MNNSMLGHPMKIEGFERGSLLEDPTWSEDLHKSFCFSPGYECETMAANYLLQDITANGFVSEGMTLEESVLKELEMVTTQLSNKTRICFRDAFYRLAKNSTQNPVALGQQGNLHAQTHSPKWTISEEKIRSGKKETTESETNTIDRTIANLTFGKIDINVRDFPVCQTRQL